MLEKAVARSYAPRHDVSLLSEHDIYLFREGTHVRLYDKLGAHCHTPNGISGVVFALWAPTAESVSVCGDFNEWSPSSCPLRPRPDGSGIWEAFLPGLGAGARYRYRVRYPDGAEVELDDPFAFCFEPGPGTAALVWDLAHDWEDAEWMGARAARNALAAPFTIYEVDLGSWRRVPEEGNRFLSYEELGQPLGDYLHHMAYTHLQCLPVMERRLAEPRAGPPSGLFAPDSRHGDPRGFMRLVDRLHRRGIGVVLDWTPAPLPAGAGTDRGRDRIWERPELRSILLSSALFWLDRYHADGLHIGAVESLLYPERAAGSAGADAAAIAFLRRLNEAVYRDHPDVQTSAEEASGWPLVARPTYDGGLGFGLKWQQGWAQDILRYFAHDPMYRKHHQDLLTRGISYAYSENHVLPLSHREVAHGKGALLGGMPGEAGARLANLRALLGFMYAHPGKKLMFMGTEFAQAREWRPEQSLDWHLLEQAPHLGMQRWVRDLNHLCRAEPALHARDFDPRGFEWVDFADADHSVVSFLRKGSAPEEDILVVCNLTPVRRDNYAVGVPRAGWWAEILNSDALEYGGGGAGNAGGREAAPIPAHGRYHALYLTLPPLAVVFFKRRS